MAARQHGICLEYEIPRNARSALAAFLSYCEELNLLLFYGNFHLPVKAPRVGWAIWRGSITGRLRID
jgi:hypothetical protein